MIERTNNGERWDDALSFHEVEKKKEKKKKKVILGWNGSDAK